MLNSENINEISGALAKAQGEMRHAEKNKTIKMPGREDYKYVSLSGVIDSIREPLSKNGLAICQQLCEQNGKLLLVTTLSHTSGQFFRSYMPIRSDILKPQDFGSEMTYKKRYSLCAMLCQDSDEDDDGSCAQAEVEEKLKNNPPTQQKAAPVIPALISREHAEEISLLVETEEDQAWIEKILGFYKVGSVKELPEKAYTSIKASYEKRVKS